jgi:hypothetical protein
MQASESPHPYITAVFQWVAMFLGSSVVGILFKDWIDRRRKRKPGVDEARARSLDGETLRATGDKMIGLFDVIYRLNLDVATERRRADEATLAASQEAMLRHNAEEQMKEAEETVRLTLFQMQQLHAAVSMKGVTLAEFPPDDLKKEIERLFPEATGIARPPLWLQH